MPSRRPLPREVPRSIRAVRTRHTQQTRRLHRIAPHAPSASFESYARRAHPIPQRPLHERTPTSNARLGARHAFTLVEVVVALVLLATAALNVAATSTYLSRLAASARAQALATRATAHVVDSLRTTPCASLGAGAVSTPAGTVRWTVSAAANTRDLRAVLTPASPRVRQPVVEEALLPCD